MPRLLSCIAFLAICVGVASQASAGFIRILGDQGDGTIDVNGLPQDLNRTMLPVGTGGNNLRGLAGVMFFSLPTVRSRASITSAQLELEYLGIAPSSFPADPDFNADLFGLGGRSTATILSGDYYDGLASLSSDALIVDDLVTPTSAAGGLTIGNPSMLSFVRSLYQANGIPTSAFAVFRLNPDIELPEQSGPLRRFEFASADNTDNGGAFVPVLEINAVPEPGAVALLLSAAGPLAVLCWSRIKKRRLTGR